MFSWLPQLGSESSLWAEGGPLTALREAIGFGRPRVGWKEWCDRSVNRRIFAAMVTVAGLTLAVKIIATLKETVIAHQFGVSDGLDAFLIAYLVPAFGINVIAGSFNAALIPTYIQVREQEGKEAAQRLFSTVMLCALSLLVVVSIGLGFLSGSILQLLGSGFSPEKLALTRTLFLVVLPTLPLTGMFAMWAAILNAGERFVIAAAAPVLTPLIVMLMVWSCGGRWGIYTFAIAMVIGAVAETALMMMALKQRGILSLPAWHGLTPPLKQVAKQYLPMLAGALMMGSTGLVDQSMAAMLGPGAVSELNYGNKVSAVVVTIGSMAVSTAVLPQFSRMTAAGSWTNVRNTVETYTRLIFLITVPVSLILVLVSPFLVSVLFERGAFTATNTVEVSAVQSLYILQLPFYVGGILFVRLISACKANHILMWGTVISFVLNIGMDYLFMQWLGVPGIALSTSGVYLVSFCYLWGISTHLLRRKNKSSGSNGFRCLTNG